MQSNTDTLVLLQCIQEGRNWKHLDSRQGPKLGCMQENFLEDSATEFPLHDETGIAELNELLDDSWWTSWGFWTVLRRTESLQLSLYENILFWAEEQSEKVLHLK